MPAIINCIRRSHAKSYLDTLCHGSVYYVTFIFKVIFVVTGFVVKSVFLVDIYGCAFCFF